MKGHSVYIRPMEKTDGDLIVSWRNSQEVSAQMFAKNGPTLAEHLAWFERYQEGDERQEFMIVVCQTDQPIGTIGLSGIDRYHRKAEYGILIGDSEHRGKGYAQEASQLILAHGFKTLGIQKISLRVFADNLSAIRLYERVGFIHEGRLHREFLKNGIFREVVLMAVFDGSDELEG